MAETTVTFDDGAAYERFMGRWSRAAGAVFLGWLSPKPGARWLDVGCGTGVFTELVVETCAPASVVAVDPSTQQITYALTVPRARLSAPRNGHAGVYTARLLLDQKSGHVKLVHETRSTANAVHPNGGLRIAAPLGEVKLDFQKVTNGLARTASTEPGDRATSKQQTTWSSGALEPGTGVSKAYNQGNSNAPASHGNAGGNGNGNGNGNDNGNGNGNGASNAAAVGGGNGNGNGNGNANGNGHGHGH
jgi:hypothetical protein